MATGLGSGTANSILNELCNAGSWTVPTSFWVKLHTGDPGAAGTSNAATNTTRQSGSFSSASAGAITTSADVTWTSVSTTETYSHVSFWDASSGGTFLASDALETSRGLTAGDNFTITAGDIDITLTPVAS